MATARLRKKKCPPVGVPAYMTTFGDMVTLLLVFFVLLINPPVPDSQRLQLIMASFNNLGVLTGGNTLEEGKLAELGNNIIALPSTTAQRRLDRDRKKAQSVFKTELRKEQVVITQDERGLVITLTGDLFFKPGTAELNMEEARPVIQNIARLLSSPEVGNRKFRIEGHTDSSDPAADSGYPTNWELSTARATNILHFLANLGVDESKFQIMGLADTAPIPVQDNQAQFSWKNNRVDVIVLREGLL